MLSRSIAALGALLAAQAVSAPPVPARPITLAELENAAGMHRARRIARHKPGGGGGPRLFPTRLDSSRFADKALQGGNGMPAFSGALNRERILKIPVMAASSARF